MKRSRLARKAPLRPSKPEPREDADSQYLAWLRTLDCCACGQAPTDDLPTYAHHATLTGRGKGQKSPDEQTMPLCWRCHGDLHAFRGRFSTMTHDTLKAWQLGQVAVHRGWYLRLFDKETL